MSVGPGQREGDEEKGVGAERTEVTPETRTRAERRLERAALRHRWPMNRDLFEALSQEQMRIALGGEVVVKREFDAEGKVIREVRQNSGPKERTAAYKALVAADALNMEQEKRELEIPDLVQHTGEVKQTVEVVFVDDFYGHRQAPGAAAPQDDRPAGADAASASPDPGPKPL